jgi:ribosomal protein L11 methyltransferase
MAHLRRVYRLPAALEDDLVADLWQAGTLGVSTEADASGALVLSAYFALPAAPLALPERLAAAVECLAEEELAEADWMAEYRRRSRPFALGRFLEIDPREPLDPRAADAAPAAELPAGGAVPAPRHLLRLPARTAFGVGSHESTALAVELLDSLDLAGRAVLDVGTGTGILAFAALLRGAGRAVAFDADPVAAFQARANSRLNELHPRLFAGRPAALSAAPAPAARFHVALINVVPEQILPEIAGLLPALTDGAEIILSGLLAEHAPAVVARLGALGFAARDRRQAGDWVALRLARLSLPPPPPGEAAAGENAGIAHPPAPASS